LIERILQWSLANRPLVLFFTLLLIVVGARSLAALPIDAVPDVTNVQVQINTEGPGLSPLEVERFLTFPIEQAMTGLPKVEEIRSLSKYGLSQVTVVFQDRVNLYFARQLVFERLQEARGEIPEGMGHPEMGPISSGLGEIYQYEVRGEGMSLMDLRILQDWFVKRQLRTVPGVTEVNSFGGEEMQFQVLIDPIRLQSYGLTFRDVFRALAENNRNAGGGLMERRGEQYLVRGVGLARDEQELGTIVLAERGGVPIHVHDVAEVVRGAALRQGAVTRDGRGEVVTGIVMMLIDENSREVAHRVHQRVQEVAQSLPQGVRLESFYDRTELVDRTIRTVAWNLGEGAFLVVVVLVAMLGNLRAALIVALAIPLSMLFAGTLMWQFGISGNLMSLGALDFGLIVDGSVVMVENAVRRLSRGPVGNVSRTVLEAGREVARPVVFGVGIIVVVYLPILALTGMEGKMFQPMAATVVFALLGSLLLALTVIPVLASFFLKPTAEETEPWLVRTARWLYEPALKASLKHPLAVAGVAGALFLASLAAFPRLGAEFLPQLDEGALAIQSIRIPSVSLTQSIEMARGVEEALLEFPEVETVVTRTGRPDIATDPMGVEISDVIVRLRPRSTWADRDKERLIARMQERLERIPGMQYSFSQPIELRVAELLSGVRADVALKIFGEDLEVLERSAEQAAQALRALPGAADVQVEKLTGLPYLQIEVDRQAIARLGINVSDVMDVVEIALGERPTGSVFEGDRRFPVVARLQASARTDPEAVGRILVPTAHGAGVPLAQLARIRLESGVAQVSRENAQRRIVVQANVRGRDLVGFVEEARTAVGPLIPTGCFATWGGQFENYEQARNRLLVVVPGAMLAIFMLLYGSFGSARQASLIFFNVPFAIVGGVGALAMRGMPFSISAGVGFIALFGVAVLNGLVLVKAINDQRERGLSVRRAVMEGALARLRPVLMTALVASLGFLPMAMSQGAGAEVQRPLATVVIGGLATSTLLTLLVLPTLYRWFETRRLQIRDR
jgi:cobalt-zinc-cadmium resistance protein CzcA